MRTSPLLPRRRRGRGRFCIAVATALLAVLAACTASDGQKHDLSSSPPSASSSRGVRVSSSAEGSPTHPRELSCQADYTLPLTADGPHDLVIGPLRYPRLRLGFSDAPPFTSPNYGAGYFYKVGTRLAAGSLATVMIGSSASRYAALVGTSSPQNGDQAITYRSCAKPGFLSWWPGGFLLLGRKNGCVPLEVAIDGGPIRHVVVSLAAGRC